MAFLAPFNPVLGPNPAYCFPEEIVLQTKEKLCATIAHSSRMTFTDFDRGSHFPATDFSIKTTTGAEVCRCKGKVFSISHRKGDSLVALILRENRNAN